MAQNIDYCIKKLETNADGQKRQDKCLETEWMSNTNKANLHKMVINNNKTIQYSSTECIKSKEGTLITEKKIVKKWNEFLRDIFKKRQKKYCNTNKYRRTRNIKVSNENTTGHIVQEQSNKDKWIYSEILVVLDDRNKNHYIHFHSATWEIRSKQMRTSMSYITKHDENSDE